MVPAVGERPRPAGRRGAVCAAGACLAVLLAGPGRADPAYLAVVIDDLGQNPREVQAVLALPPGVAGAVLPHTPYARAAAESLHRDGRDVLLHLPMQSIGPREAGPGALTLGMPPREIAITVDYDLLSVPHAVGVNNHMGSRLTQDLSAMRVLMGHLKRRGGLFFLDSLTSADSVARTAAAERAVPFFARDVFLDSDRAPHAIRAQLAHAVARARAAGSAIAIGHPYAETLAVLHERLPRLRAEGVELVSVSQLSKMEAAPGRSASSQGRTDGDRVHHGERTDSAGTGI